jgi:hypothetical protein
MEYKKNENWKKQLQTAFDDPTKFVCTRPFVEVISTVNQYRPCCYALEFPNTPLVNNLKPFEFFKFDKDITRIRNAMMGYSDDSEILNKICYMCKEREAEGIKSPRQIYNHKFLTYNNVEGEIWPDEDIENMSKKILEWKGEEFEPLEHSLAIRMRLFGNFCNLKCVTCKPGNSSQLYTEFNQIRQENPNDLKKLHRLHIDIPEKLKTVPADDAKEDILHNIKYVRTILMIGGETMLAPKHFNWLDKIVESGYSKNIEIRYQTNLTEIHRYASKIFDYTDKFKSIYFIGSIDSVGDKNDYIRYGSDWNTLINNLELVKQSNIGIIINITTSWLSVLHTGELCNFLTNLGIKPHVNGSVVFRPDFLSPRHLPDELKSIAYENLKKYIPKEEDYKVLSSELLSPRDPIKFKLGCDYFDILDKKRKSNWLEVFPEFKRYV